jgi:ATP-dependent Lon protease
LCEQNRNDIEDINPDYLTGLSFHYVNTIDQVLELALTSQLVDKPLVFSN